MRSHANPIRSRPPPRLLARSIPHLHMRESTCDGIVGILIAMCGRIEYVVTSKKVLEGRYGARLVEGVTFQGLVNARYNIAPSSHTPLITSENSEEFQLGHWGYLPTWASKQSKARVVINARSETVFEKSY